MKASKIIWIVIHIAVVILGILSASIALEGPLLFDTTTTIGLIKLCLGLSCPFLASIVGGIIVYYLTKLIRLPYCQDENSN